MKKLSLNLLLLCSLTMSIAARGSNKFFIGILPDITREIKDNDEKVFSINVLPLAIEPGYSWVLEKGFSMNLGLQLGGTYFTASDESGGWRNHTGLNFSLGYTFRSKSTAIKSIS